MDASRTSEENKSKDRLSDIFLASICGPDERVQRRLAAIMVADVVGSCEFEQFKRELVEPSLSRNNGRLIKRKVDAALADFASPYWRSQRCGGDLASRSDAGQTCPAGFGKAGSSSGALEQA
jgi:hypothetical protein